MTTTSSTTSTPATTTSTTSNASLGQSILTTLNASGGIDTDTLITQLTAAQKSAVETPITTKQTANTAQISEAATISSDLSTFSTSLNTLVSGGTLQSQPASSDTSVMTVAAVAGISVGNLAETVTVNQLAYAQSIKSSAYATAQVLDTGTLSLKVGSGAAIPITITSDNNTLSGIATAINAKKAGVTATVVTGSDGNSTLVLKGATGASSAFTLTGTDDTAATQADGALSLGNFTYPATTTTTTTTGTDDNGDPTTTTSSTGMTATQAAQDASVTVDGVTVSRASNTFSDLIPGVNMTIAKTGTVNLSATRPTAAITEAVSDFVSAYNELMTELNTATAAATSNSDAGPLRGNSAIRSLKNQLSKLTTTNLNASGSIRTLAELGVKTAQDGSLSVDATQLSNMLTNYPDDVEAMFVTSQSSSSSKVLITGASGASASGIYNVTNISSTHSNADGNATGSINGVPMSASSWTLSAVSANDADGLQLQILSGAPTSATITINQGLGGALSAIQTLLSSKTGDLTTLQSSLATQKASLADALTKADAQVTVYHDRLVTQFSTMTTLVSGYKATASYLTQQTDLWDKSS